MRWRDHDVFSSLGEEVLRSQGVCILVMYAIPIVPAFLVGAYGAFGGFCVVRYLVDTLFLHQPADAKQQGHGLPLLGSSHSGAT